MARAKKSFLLRIDPDLFADIERAASADLRSVNAQIEFLLRESIRRRLGRTREAAPAEADDPARSGQ
jgi:hypothetical protein